MRLFFKPACIDLAAFQQATEQFGVGAVRCDPPDGTAPEKGDGRIVFALFADKVDPAAVLKIAEESGLEYDGKDDAVECSRNEKPIKPKTAAAVKDGEAIVIE